MSNIVCFGEVLWDVFPTYKKIGGAPLNVALRLNSFDNAVTMISSVGDDALGVDLLKYLEDIGFDKSFIQINKEFKTSKVLVSLDETGSANYSIEFPCAWDNIHLDDKFLDVVKYADAFVFGSLVSRNTVSYNTLLQLLDVAKFKVFDVNLRPPHYKIAVLFELMQKANFIKFNDDELFEICKELNFNSNDLQKNIEFISKETNTEAICVTLGGDGAILFQGKKFYRNNGYKVKVIDTVGAGDSFLATLIHQTLRNGKPSEALNYSCVVGAIVASKSGANPKVTSSEIDTYLKR
ncbi:carbohydrate kinase family protein [Hyunsoonleella aestuarii]|uniref:Carbohydrate kinase n=1 Tax=Hyunsoonleella aestuarii TaxID=912802 RepID=A0ABP8E9B1_9FLAO|nr:carbohydrate kinase [Hyunsoonleella aestuarii]